MKVPKISIQIGADTKRLKRDMKKADSLVTKFTTAAKYGMASAAAAAGAFAFTIAKDGVQAAIEDEASQAKLQKQIENTTKATEAQIKANEEYITQTQLRYGVEDVALRASLGKLATVTGSLTKAQKLQGIALDVAAGAGISLEAATTLVTKAQQGSFTAFKKLGIVLDENIIKNKDGAAAVEVLGKKYEGAAASAADTTQGKLKRLGQAWDETVEGVGEALLPYLEDMADWATSPEGALALTQFMKDFQKAIADTAKGIQVLGEWLDNITPDADTWAGGLLSFNGQQSRKGINDINRGAYFSQQQYRANTNMFAAQDPRITINVSGALDSKAVAAQIKKILAQNPSNVISDPLGKRSR